MRTCTVASPSSGPWCFLQSRGQRLFSHWQHEQNLPIYPACSLHTHWGKILTKYANTCQMEILNVAYEQRLQMTRMKISVLSNQTVINLCYAFMKYFPTYIESCETRWLMIHHAVTSMCFVLTCFKIQMKRTIKHLLKPRIDALPSLNVTFVLPWWKVT